MEILAVDQLAIVKGFERVQNNIIRDETMIDITTTPFECLLRTVRIIESYLHVADFYQEILEASPRKYGFPGHALSTKTSILRYWTITNTDVAESIGSFWCLGLYGLLEKALKYFTASLLARTLRQVELPDEPKWVKPLEFLSLIFPSATWHKWWNGILSSKKLRDCTQVQRFAYNFYMAKNASLPVSESFVEAAMIKHRAALCGVVDGVVGQVVNSFNLDLPGDRPDLKENILESVQRAANEIFYSGKQFEHPLEEWTEHENGETYVCQMRQIKPVFEERRPGRVYPSLGASYAFGRANGGAAGEMFYNIGGWREEERKGKEGKYTYYSLCSPVFLGYAAHPQKKYLVEPIYGTCDPLDAEYEEDCSRDRALDGQIRFGHQWTKSHNAADLLQWHKEHLESLRLEGLAEIFEFNSDVHEYGVQLCKYNSGEEKYTYRHQHVFAEVVPLLEAFKVRTITKGDMDPYHLGRRWQAKIHARMRKHPAAQLIGAPCKKEVLLDRIINNDLVPKTKETFYVSGDYESATDLLNPALSLEAQNAISMHLRIPLEDQIILNRCLTGHHLIYQKETTCNDEEGYKQQWGQLMGSPVSFPVLCLINLAATRLSFEMVLGRKCTLAELPMVVNGDDILFRAVNQAHYTLWKEITKVCGLKFSLGKNYTSRKVLVINSEFYKTSRRGVRKVPQINMRLLYGGTRSAVGGLVLRPCDLIASLQSARVLGEKYYSDYVVNRLPIDEITKKTGGKKLMKLLSEKGLSQSKKNIAAAWRIKCCYEDWERSRPQRLEDYKKWFITVPARNHIFVQQIKGDYDVNDVEVSKGVILFSGKQVKRFELFRKEFPQLHKISLAYFLPRALGGLGLTPPPHHRYTNIDCSVVQGCHENPTGAYALVQANHVGLVHSHLMATATAEVASVCRTLGVEPVMLRENQYDQHLETFGETESPFTGGFMRGFANLSPCVTDDDLITKYAAHATRGTQTGNIKAASKFNVQVRERCARWKRELGVTKGVPRELDLNLNAGRLLGGFWNMKVQMYPVMV